MDKKAQQVKVRELESEAPRFSGVVARARPSFNSFLEAAPILDSMMASVGAGFELSMGPHGVFTSSGFQKAASSGNLRKMDASFAEFDVTITVAAPQEGGDAIARMAAYALIGEVSTGLAHDFKNVLTVLTADLDILKGKASQGRMESGEVSEHLEEMEEAVMLGLGICNRFERMAAAKKELKSENLWAIVDSSIRLLRSPLREMQGMGKRVVFEEHVPQDLWVDVIYRDVQSAMLNIMLNALRHGFRERKDGTLSLVGQSAGGRVYLHIANDGEPVPEALRAMLLRQPVPSMESWGVGLYVSSQSLRTFGAELTFESDGNGTDFVIAMSEGKAPA